MTEPLDMSKDPDRFVPDAGPPPGPLDPALDPDRYDPQGRGRTLPQLLGEGAYEEPRETWTWLFGLLGILLFLVVVSVLLSLA